MAESSAKLDRTNSSSSSGEESVTAEKENGSNTGGAVGGAVAEVASNEAVDGSVSNGSNGTSGLFNFVAF